jgi:drug/metabolite transporter (DMT)-like permease
VIISSSSSSALLTRGSVRRGAEADKLPPAAQRDQPGKTPPAPERQGPASQLLVALALGAVYLIWSGTYLALRFVVQALPTMLTVGLRFVVAGTVLCGVLRLRGQPWPSSRQLVASLPAGVLLFVVGNGFVALAEREVSSGAAALVCATMPLCAAGLNFLAGRRPHGREWLGLLLGFAGVAVLCLGKDLQAAPQAMMMLLLAPIGWALGSTWARRLPLPPGLMGAATQMLMGGVVAAGVALLRGERLPAQWPLLAVGSLGYLIVFGSLIAFSAYTYLLSHTRPAVAMSYAYVNPGLAVVLGALLGGEPLHREVIGASALIVAGVFLMALPRRSARAAV